VKAFRLFPVPGESCVERKRLQLPGEQSLPAEREMELRNFGCGHLMFPGLLFKVKHFSFLKAYVKVLVITFYGPVCTWSIEIYVYFIKIRALYRQILSF
jgi:hypothetical protein